MQPWCLQDVHGPLLARNQNTLQLKGGAGQLLPVGVREAALVEALDCFAAHVATPQVRLAVTPCVGCLLYSSERCLTWPLLCCEQMYKPLVPYRGHTGSHLPVECGTLNYLFGMVPHTLDVDLFDPATSWLQAKRQLAAGLAALWGVSPEQAHYHLELAKPQLLPAAGQVAVGRAGLPVVDSQPAQTAAQVSKLELRVAVAFTKLLL